MTTPSRRSRSLSRRSFIARSSSAAMGSLVAGGFASQSALAFDPPPAVHQALGTRVGEVTPTSAIVWTRITQAAKRNSEGITFPAKSKAVKPGEPPEVTTPVAALEGACPGAAGRVRVRYGIDAELKESRATEWQEVTADGDFIHQFALAELSPDTQYYYASEALPLAGDAPPSVIRGTFRTAPALSSPSDFTFTVMTCQGYPDRGHADGHAIYPAMQALAPRFTCLTGDLVYYDNDAPRAISPELARYHWERMFSLPRLVEFTRNVPTYWLKDDHDTLSNDAWPGQKQGRLTYAEGQAIFRQQAPLADGPSYRRFRYGRDLEVWFTDGRDHRSPNKMPDGPEKSIWGAEQMAWFQQTVEHSDATWKILVSPTPLVGPDRPNKNDNHANEGFQHEGDMLRAWLRAHVPDNFFVICGDRHWQYHSVHPQSGLHEFCAGAASNEHAGGTPGENKAYHRFHRVKGGFLSVQLAPTTTGSAIVFRHHDVDGKVVYEFAPPARQA